MTESAAGAGVRAGRDGGGIERLPDPTVEHGLSCGLAVDVQAPIAFHCSPCPAPHRGDLTFRPDGRGVDLDLGCAVDSTDGRRRFDRTLGFLSDPALPLSLDPQAASFCDCGRLRSPPFEGPRRLLALAFFGVCLPLPRLPGRVVPSCGYRSP